MIYKYDPLLKEKYCKRLILYYVLFFVGFMAFLAGFNVFIFNLLGVGEAPELLHVYEIFAVFFLIIFGLSYRMLVRYYDAAEVELTDEFIEYRLPSKKVSVKIPLSEISAILKFPNFIDKNRLRVSGKKWKGFTVSSYLTGFDEIKEKLQNARPDIKISSITPHKFFWSTFYVIGVVLSLAGFLFFRPTLIVSFVMYLIYLVIRASVILRSEATKTAKRTIVITYIFYAVIFAATCAFFLFNGTFKKSVFKKVPGQLRLQCWIVDELNKYDKNGNLIYYTDFDYDEYEYKYDNQNRKIYEKYKKEDYEEWFEYDETTGLLVREWDSDGWECKKEYNSDGKEIHYKTSADFEAWTSYEGNSEIYKTSENYETLREYDDDENLIHFRSTEDGVVKTEYWVEYENGNPLHVWYADGRQYWNQYDAKGNFVYQRWLSGDEYLYDYDENGNKIHSVTNFINPDTGNTQKQEECWYKYNEHNDMIYYECDGTEFVNLYDYVYDKNGKILKRLSTAIKKEEYHGNRENRESGN